MPSMRPLALFLLAFLASCAGTRGGGSFPGLPRWPYAGVNRLKSPTFALYQNAFFSGRNMEIDPSGRVLYAEAGIPGAITEVSLPDGSIQAVDELGHGALLEGLLVHPDGNPMFLLASTVQPENYGQVQLARALLKVDTGLSLLLSPISLKPDGYSHGLAFLQRDGLLFSLDTAGSDPGGGATLSRIDVVADELTARRPVGVLPVAVRRRGMATDRRGENVFALLSEGGQGSDFDPDASRQQKSTVSLTAISRDSLTIEGRLSLSDGPSWYALAATPRGILVAGNTAHGTTLVEVDTQWMRPVAWLDLPDPTTDLVSAGEIAVLPGRFGLYVVNLGFLSVQRFIPVDFRMPTEAAISSDAGTACVMLEDPRWPGKPALGIFDLRKGGLDRIVQ